MKSKRKTSKKSAVGKKVLYIFTSLLGVVIILMSCAYGAFYHYYSRMNIVTGDEDENVSAAEIRAGEDLDSENFTEEDKNQLEELSKQYSPNSIKYDFSDPDITNIMIVGTDSRRRGRYRSNSDAMVLISINKKTQKLFITSFMRDILVDIPKGGNRKVEGKGKLNAAFGNGGSSLMFETYEKNFGIKIDKFAHVDFFDFVNLIDYLGGIKMYVSADEIRIINSAYLVEINKLYGRRQGTDNMPVKSGTYRLNGKQALAYTRIRYIGGDAGRTERQRKVIAEIFNKVKSMSAKKLSDFSERALRYVTTNLSQTDVMGLIMNAPEILEYEQINTRIPLDKTFTSGKINGTYVINMDFQKNTDYWYSLVYLDKDITDDLYKIIAQEKAKKEAASNTESEAASSGTSD